MGTVQLHSGGGNFAGVVGVDGDMEIILTQYERERIAQSLTETKLGGDVLYILEDRPRGDAEHTVSLLTDTRLRSLERFVALLMEKDAKRDLMEFDEVVIADSEKDRGAHGLRKLYADELMFTLHREHPSYHMDSETAYAIIDWIGRRFVSKGMYSDLESKAATVRAAAQHLPRTSAT